MATKTKSRFVLVNDCNSTSGTYDTLEEAKENAYNDYEILEVVKHFACRSEVSCKSVEIGTSLC